MKMGIVGIVVVASGLFGACGGDDGSASATSSTLAAANADPKCAPGEGCKISREQFGEQWPFTVESGVLGCGAVESSPGVGKVVFEADGSGGTFYAINGIAKGFADEQGWHQLEEIWADNPATAKYGGKVNIQPMIALGLSICP